MAINFNWICPYCNTHATITNSNFSSNKHIFVSKNLELAIKTKVINCPNQECNEFQIKASLHTSHVSPQSGLSNLSPEFMAWELKPNSLAKQFPTYVPKGILDDYREACLIKELSPKASATLSRRCLQGIIRDFFDCKKGTLFDEINSIKGKIDPLVWDAIHSVRSIGNIGAHMEKDINLIIDVEPKEAQLLIELIEMLIKDLYITRHERQKRLESIVDIANQKAEKKSNLALNPNDEMLSN